MMTFRASFLVGSMGFFSVFSCVAQNAIAQDALKQKSAEKISIVTTIKPLALIANDISGGRASVDILLPDNASPHDYALKPSDIKTLSRATLIFWVGPEIEPFLTKLLSEKPNAVPLITYPGMPVRHVDNSAEHKGHDHKGHDHKGEDDHSHEGVDGHIWLGPDQSLVIAKAIATGLIEKDPQNEAFYRKNLDRFIKEVQRTRTEIQFKLNALPSKGYVLFHDGYGYFESAFGLKPTGYITVSPERKAGARTLLTIRTDLQKKKAQCVFSESQFNPAIIKSMTKGTGAKVVMLDPMAKDLSLNTHRYVDFLAALGESYQACFRQ